MRPGRSRGWLHKTPSSADAAEVERGVGRRTSLLTCSYNSKMAGTYNGQPEDICGFPIHSQQTRCSNSGWANMKSPHKSVDRHRPGYPRYSALLSTHPSFHNFRRFTRLRMRLLLQKQDEVSRLEEKLDNIDAQETHHIFLGCMRRDINPERLRLFQELKVVLAEYGLPSISLNRAFTSYVLLKDMTASFLWPLDSPNRETH